MSLSALVDFAQQRFGSLAERTSGLDPLGPGLEDAEKVDAQAGSGRAARPRLPSWMSQRTVDQELAADPEHPWRIDGPIERQQPPPDADTLGADALAFYAPFHFYRNEWGIFIRMSGVVHLAEVLKGGALRPGDEHLLDLAESVLAEHEWHHAATEIACTRAELVARRPLYLPYFASTEAAQHEEALANAQAITWVFDSGPAKSRAESWMSRQGPGYREYGSWLAPRLFSKGIDRAARFMTASLPDQGPRADPSLHTFLFRGTHRYRSMPYTRVNDLGALGVTVLRPFPKEHGVQVFVHSNDHPPPHIHVKALSGEEETRYSWPDLIPLENDRPLSSSVEKRLRRYVESHRTRIGARVEAVYGGLV